MSKVKITKVKYVIQYKDSINGWIASGWNGGGKDSSDLSNMLLLLERARESIAKCVTVNNGLIHKKYRLVKQTHYITTEVVDE